MKEERSPITTFLIWFSKHPERYRRHCRNHFIHLPLCNSRGLGKSRTLFNFFFFLMVGGRDSTLPLLSMRRPWEAGRLLVMTGEKAAWGNHRETAETWRHWTSQLVNPPYLCLSSYIYNLQVLKPLGFLFHEIESSLANTCLHHISDYLANIVVHHNSLYCHLYILTS